ncbi:VIT family-domain-containing protein [Biscogniauxia mediterranea]|nr:VIT family-domain-containing protein [Biscogniauxia mediterranea]
MDVYSVFPSLSWPSRHGRRENASAYLTLPTTPTTAEGNTSSEDDSESDDVSVKPYETEEHKPRPTTRSLSRFLADFTLGFADGLTVPFALTAGLSSLGQTNTVIYAGMAEICAGCLSMGIGGYLAARGEEGARKCAVDDYDDDGGDEEKSPGELQDSLESYLAPLHLPPDLLQSVRAHVNSSGASDLPLSRLSSMGDTEASPSSPCFIGFSISLGYLLGGLLPLFPYFFVSDVVQGLQWSFGICLVALFIFGFVKDYLLQTRPAGGEEEGWHRAMSNTRSSARWRRVKHSIWEGMRMVVLGGLAAVAAVLCVRLFEGIVS